MENGDLYFINDQGVISLLPSNACVAGSYFVPQNITVKRMAFVNGHLLPSRSYTYTSYNTDSYMCLEYDGKLDYNPADMILPATLIMLCFFSIIYHWFLRLRG